VRAGRSVASPPMVRRRVIGRRPSDRLPATPTPPSPIPRRATSTAPGDCCGSACRAAERGGLNHLRAVVLVSPAPDPRGVSYRDLQRPCRRRRRTRTRTRRAGASRTTGAFMPFLTGSTSGTRTPPSPAGPRHIRGPRSAGWSRSTTFLTTVASGRRRSCSSVPVPYVA
jgi:hypothetical protein